MDLSVAYIYGEAMDLAKKYGLKTMFLLLINMAFGIVFTFMSMPNGFFDLYMRTLNGDTHAANQLANMNQTNVPVSIVQYVVAIFMSAVLYQALISFVRGRNISVVDAFKVPLMTFVKFVGLTIALCVIIVLGMVCFIIPGIYLGVRLFWSLYYIIEHREAGIMEAFKWSWSATSGHVLELIGLFLIAFVGIIALVVVMGILGAVSIMTKIVAIILIPICIALYLCAIVVVYFAQTKVYGELCVKM